MADIAIIDYGLGNIQSVYNAFSLLGADVCVTASREVIENANKIVLPGVSAFDDTIRELSSKGLDSIIRKSISSGKYFLGLCLGLQVLFESSEEGNLPGLSILKGNVRKFPKASGFKIPHMGWNTVKFSADNAIAKGIEQDSFFYFVHSYYAQSDDLSLIGGRSEYAQVEFISCVRKDNIFATQFHPEKSQDKGLKMIKNFMEL
ncbi:MAG: imidazole glycerol phosphate synthase subunit HisH [Candidatus Omnitrophica bacterium]|nr:imidazole glycerol phosphate synthase subunit HisH [Candidatus Omnitrophota bacterium]